MTGVTQILASIERGDPYAADRLLPLVYDELRRLAAARMAVESPGQTVQATALVQGVQRTPRMCASVARLGNGLSHEWAAPAEMRSGKQITSAFILRLANC